MLSGPHLMLSHTGRGDRPILDRIHSITQALDDFLRENHRTTATAIKGLERVLLFSDLDLGKPFWPSLLLNTGQYEL